MKGKSPYNYVKTVYLSDLFKAVMRRLPLVVLAMIAAFCATFVPKLISGSAAAKEPPCYSYAVSIKIQSDFDSNSILNCANVAFSEENLQKLIDYEKFDIDPASLRQAMTYDSEAKGILRLVVYTKDEDTARRFMDGAKYICVPVLAEQADATDWKYSFAQPPQKIKIDIFTNDGEPGFVSVKGAHATLWDEYLEEETGLAQRVKNSGVFAVSVGLIIAIVIMLIRVTSRKLVTVTDVEAAAGRPVTAVLGKDGSGMGFLAEMVKSASAGSGKVELIPVKGMKQAGSISGLAEKLSDMTGKEVEITLPVSESPDAAFGDAPAMLLIEDENTTDIELINAFELIQNAGGEIKGIVICGVDAHKLKSGKDYFGKYYRDKGKTE